MAAASATPHLCASLSATSGGNAISEAMLSLMSRAVSGSARHNTSSGLIRGVVFSGMFGLGMVLYVKIETNIHLDHILFGDILGVNWGDILETGAIALVVGGILLVKWRDLLLHAFDPAQAQAVGLRVRLLHYGLLAILSLTIVGALKAVGIILAIAILIAPGAIAFLLARTFAGMLILSVIVAVLASVVGVYAAFFINSSPAPTIVLLLTLIIIGAYFYATRKTILVQAEQTG